MTRVTGITEITRMTGMEYYDENMTGITWVTGVTWVNRMT